MQGETGLKHWPDGIRDFFFYADETFKGHCCTIFAVTLKTKRCFCINGSPKIVA